MTPKRYYIYDSNLNIYFTRQEARCMYYAIYGLSNAQIAANMQLSLRTVDSYFEVMRQKVGSPSKKSLIEKITKTNFMKYMDELLILETDKERNQQIPLLN